MKTYTGTSKNPGISIITCTNRPNRINFICQNYLRQLFDKKELIIILNKDSMNIKEWEKKTNQYKNIKVFQCSESKTLGECKNFAINQSNFEYVAFFDDDDYYGESYLNESIKAFNDVKCDIVGKSTCFVYFEKNKTLAIYNIYNENTYTNYVMDSSLIIKRRVFENISFEHSSQPETPFQIICSAKGYKIYSTNKYNYVVHRHLNPQVEHTWKISQVNLLRYCEIVKRNITNYEKYVNK